MNDLSPIAWAVAALSAMLIGLSKTGLPGTGILAVLAMAAVIPARASTGLILPLLIVGDLLAVGYYRRRAAWPCLFKLLPCGAAGVLIGYRLLAHVNDQQLRPLIGAIILAMLAFSAWRSRNSAGGADVPSGWTFAVVMGLSAGITTMLSNAAGPIMIAYLLAMRLPKEEFIGTAAWYFMIVNLFKVPFSADLGLITTTSLRFNLALVPAVVAGAALGVVLAKRISGKAFTVSVQILAVAGALKLLLSWR